MPVRIERRGHQRPRNRQARGWSWSRRPDPAAAAWAAARALVLTTLDIVLAQARLRELDALSRVRRAIVANSTDPVWVYALAALDARLSVLRNLLAREDPQVLRTCEAQLDDARQLDALVRVSPTWRPAIAFTDSDHQMIITSMIIITAKRAPFDGDAFIGSRNSEKVGYVAKKLTIVNLSKSNERRRGDGRMTRDLVRSTCGRRTRRHPSPVHSMIPSERAACHCRGSRRSPERLSMPRKSQTENVRKICGCKQWKTCAHPWYLDFQRDNIRYRDNLDQLIGRHAPDFTAAKDEARRAIVAKLEGRDPKGLAARRRSDAGASCSTHTTRERPRRDRWQVGRIVQDRARSPDGPRPFGEWRVSAVTAETLTQFRRQSAARRRQSGSRPAAGGVQLGGAARAAAPLAVPRRRRAGDQDGARRSADPAPAAGRRRTAPRPQAAGLQDIITAALETGLSPRRDSLAPVAPGALHAAR